MCYAILALRSSGLGYFGHPVVGHGRFSPSGLPMGMYLMRPDRRTGV